MKSPVPSPPAPITPAQEKVLNFLMGQVMKATEGRANPVLARHLLLERLETMDE